MPSLNLLRPEFTSTLADRLLHGAGINLVGPHGQGRRRTLADLYDCLPDSLQVLQANLREYPHSLAAMLADLRAQAELADAGRFDDLLDRLQARHARTLIILHNLDELQKGRDSGYDDGFFTLLNGMDGHVGLSLLCISECLHEAWPLDIEAVMLPPLSEAQILAELKRRQPPVATSAWPGIAAWITAQPTPYTLLEQPEAWPPA